MPALGRFLNILDEKIEAPEFERSFVATVLVEWERRAPQATALVRDVEREMSPATLLERSPLAGMPESERAWLAPLVHQLWLRRYAIRDGVKRVGDRISDVQIAYIELQERLRNCADPSDAVALRPFRAEFVRFRDACRNLSQAIEGFPTEIKVV
jgi:hypothetical protein